MIIKKGKKCQQRGSMSITRNLVRVAEPKVHIEILKIKLEMSSEAVLHSRCGFCKGLLRIGALLLPNTECLTNKVYQTVNCSM
jgi:hypothetical protein